MWTGNGLEAKATLIVVKYSGKFMIWGHFNFYMRDNFTPKD